MGRLQRGQKAASVRDREQAIDASIERRIDVLSDLVQQGQIPNGFTAHRSIKALCSWKDVDAGIHPVARNTLRSRQEAYNQLRELQERLKVTERNRERANTPKARRDTNADLRHRNAKLRDQVQQLTDALVELRAMYHDLLADQQAAAQNDQARQAAIRRHRERYPLHPVTEKTDDDTVINLSDAESNASDSYHG